MGFLFRRFLFHVRHSFHVSFLLWIIINLSSHISLSLFFFTLSYIIRMQCQDFEFLCCACVCGSSVDKSEIRTLIDIQTSFLFLCCCWWWCLFLHLSCLRCALFLLYFISLIDDFRNFIFCWYKKRKNNTHKLQKRTEQRKMFM